MTAFEEKFAVDLATLSVSETDRRYREKVEEGTTISGIVEALKKRGLLTTLIRSDWRNDGKDCDGLYLIRAGGSYQVFMGERGIKLWLEEFRDLEIAARSWADLVLNQLYYRAPDSKIG